MKYFRNTMLILLLILLGCSNLPELAPVPTLGNSDDISLSGTWTFDQQDEQSFQHMQNAINFVPMDLKQRRSNYGQNSSQSDFQNREQKILRNLLVGLLTIVPKELYILQTQQQVAIDFGVAGYHTFNILQQTKILMDGFEIEAYAGWMERDLIIRLSMGNSYQLIEKFTLINPQQLVETIELQFLGGEKFLSHKRYFIKKIN